MDERTFTDADGVEIFYRRWDHPSPDGVVIVAHGASEHSGRYDRFAQALVGAGYAVYAPDHRGHGRTAASSGAGRMGPGGGDALVEDLHQLVGIAGQEHPALPVVVFGHSMGSMITLAYITRHSAGLAGAVLCGYPVAPDGGAELGAMFQEAVDAGMADEPADLLKAFNEPFEPGRTGYEWLSRDEAEVDKYVADAMCGDDNPLTYGFFVDLVEIVGRAVEPGALAAIRCPVLVIAGDQDPAAGMGAYVTAAEETFRAAGVEVTATLYPDARHELLNERNRDEVTADVISWIAERIKA